MPVNDAVKIFKALADPTRLRILLLLEVRELCVCELTYILGMEQSRISHHMRILREAGLAEDLRQGRWMIYRTPARAKEFVGGLVAGLRRARLERPALRAGDVRKLADCVRKNVRACHGGGPGPRPAGGRRELGKVKGEPHG
jgi:ArsR family transcriptional regulator, arsenate/arsenite/antimonite-responsive transcriptional repressor